MTRTNNKRVKMLIIVLTTLILGILGTAQGFTTNLPALLEKAKTEYTKFKKDIKDITILQKTKIVTPEGEEIISKTKILKKGNKFRIETTTFMPQVLQMPERMGPMKIIIIYDGISIWMISPFMEKKKLLSEEAKQYQIEENWWNWVSEKAEIIGTEKVSRRECYIVKIKEKEAPANKIWLDKKTLALIRAEIECGKGETMFVTYSDFRKIKNDWEIPYKNEVSKGEKLISSSIVKSFEINKGLFADLFDADKAEVKDPLYLE